MAKKILALAFALVLGAALGGQAADYPTRDITNVVVWAAGGGTDVCNRIVMAEMQKVLNAPHQRHQQDGRRRRLHRHVARPRPASRRLHPGRDLRVVR